MKTFRQFLEELSHEKWTSSDGMVHGAVDIGDNYVSIYEWGSKEKGHTVKALQELKSLGKPITVHDIGWEPTDPSHQNIFSYYITIMF
jgi:hypothetical protein